MSCATVDQCGAELFVAAAAVGDIEVLARLSRGGATPARPRGTAVGEPGAVVADLRDQGRGPDHTGSQFPPDAAAWFLTEDAQRSQRHSQRCCLTFVTRGGSAPVPPLAPGPLRKSGGRPSPRCRSPAALGTARDRRATESPRHLGLVLLGGCRTGVCDQERPSWGRPRAVGAEVGGSKAASRTARCRGLGRPFGAVANLSRSEHEGVRSSDDHFGAIGEDHRDPPLGDLHACVRHRRRKTRGRRHRKDRSPGSRCGLRRLGRESIDVGHQGRGAPSASLILYAEAAE